MCVCVFLTGKRPRNQKQFQPLGKGQSDIAGFSLDVAFVHRLLGDQQGVLSTGKPSDIPCSLPSRVLPGLHLEGPVKPP